MLFLVNYVNNGLQCAVRHYLESRKKILVKTLINSQFCLGRDKKANFNPSFIMNNKITNLSLQ